MLYMWRAVGRWSVGAKVVTSSFVLSRVPAWGLLPIRGCELSFGRCTHTLGGMDIFVRNGLVERVGRANRDIYRPDGLVKFDLRMEDSSGAWQSGLSTARGSGSGGGGGGGGGIGGGESRSKRLTNDVTNDSGCRARAPDPTRSDRIVPDRIGVARLAALASANQRTVGPTDRPSERTHRQLPG